MLEKSFADNPAFQNYKKRTSAFFPLPLSIFIIMKEIIVDDSMQTDYVYLITEKIGEFSPRI